MYDIITEIKTIRQQIVDDHNLKAVISLPAKAGSLFSGACILIFNKQGPGTTGTTDKVWFYKMEGNKGINKKDADSTGTGKNDVFAFAEEYDEVLDILTRWENGKDETGRSTDTSFYVSAYEIKTNNYILSFNDYRKIVKVPELHIPTQPFIPEEKNAAGITTRELAEPTVKKKKLPAPVAPVKKRFSTIFVSLVVICLAAAAFYFIFLNNKNAIFTSTKNKVSPGKIKPEQPPHNLVTTTPVPGMLSQEQIRAILRDTTGIIHFRDQPANISVRKKDPGKRLAKNANENTLMGKKPVNIPEPGTSGGTLKVQYTVTDTTFFHDKPDESTRRKTYLDPLNKNILNPLRDQNGYIYIEYTNHFGRTSKGWINKKDLRPLR